MLDSGPELGFMIGPVLDSAPAPELGKGLVLEPAPGMRLPVDSAPVFEPRLGFGTGPVLEPAPAEGLATGSVPTTEPAPAPGREVSWPDPVPLAEARPSIIDAGVGVCTGVPTGAWPLFLRSAVEESSGEFNTGGSEGPGFESSVVMGFVVADGTFLVESPVPRSPTLGTIPSPTLVVVEAGGISFEPTGTLAPTTMLLPTKALLPAGPTEKVEVETVLAAALV